MDNIAGNGGDPRMNQQLDDGVCMKKLTKGQNKLLQTIGGRGFLRRTVIDGEEVFFTDTGRRVNRRTVKHLIAAGKIVPVGDGLFEGDTQSYEAA